MSLKHEFILISNPQKVDVSRLEIMRDELTEMPIIGGGKLIQYIDIEDSLICYLNDFLNWIPRDNNNGDLNIYGLNYYGITIFSNENSIQLSKLYTALVSLFSFAPVEISLKGEFCWNEEDYDSGKYEELIFNKTCLLEKLQVIASWHEELITDKDTQIIHLGI